MSLFRKTALLVLSLVITSHAVGQQLPIPPSLAAKSWLLLEMGSNQMLTSEKPDERLEPASLTKLMTAYLTFAAIHKKTIALEQAVPVSEKAWRTGGSKMFVRVDTQVPVEDLIKGMIVQSGNDACVTLAEAIAGSEENFAQMMNREAQRLGMKSSSFRNSTGLPDPEHYTTARDLSLLASALIRDFPEEYKKYYSMKEFTYNGITQPNRNRLLYIDPTVDGVKTGHTEAAGYCLISSALRDKRRLLSVVLGTASDSARASESQKLLNWGFISYDADTVAFAEAIEYALGIAEPVSVIEEKFKNISITPNPASEFIHITDLRNSPFTLTIINANGAIIQTMEGSNRDLDVRSLPNGLYFLKVLSQESYYSTPFVKN